MKRRFLLLVLVNFVHATIRDYIPFLGWGASPAAEVPVVEAPAEVNEEAKEVAPVKEAQVAPTTVFEVDTETNPALDFDFKESHDEKSHKERVKKRYIKEFIDDFLMH